MFWLFSSLLAEVLFAGTNVCDKILRGRMGTFTMLIASGLASIFGGFFILFAGPIGLEGVALAALAGILWYFAAIPYYHSLSIEEASRVVPLWLLQVPFTFVLSLVFLGESLTGRQYAALLLILAGSFIISTKKLRDVLKISPVLLFMALASFLVSVALVLGKHLLGSHDFWAVQAAMLVVAFPCSLLLLCIKKYRKSFVSDAKKINGGFGFLLAFRQVLTASAYVLYTLAILNGPTSIVVALSGLAGFFVFVAASVITIIKPSLMKEDLGWKSLLTKALSIGLISAGAILAVR